MKKLFKFSSILFLGLVCLTAFKSPLEAKSRTSFSFGISFSNFFARPVVPVVPVVQYQPRPVIVQQYYTPYYVAPAPQAYYIQERIVPVWYR